MEYNIVDTIMMLNEQCCHLNETGGHESDLTAKELRVLLSLNEEESITSIELAKRNMLSPSRMSRIIDKLASGGFLHRETDDHDRRYHRVSLTEKAYVTRQDTLAFKKRCESKIKSKLSEHEFAIIQKALHLMLFAMENENGNDTNEQPEHH